MARTAIKNQRYHIIGYIEDVSGGRQQALNAQYHIIGHYDPATDKTKDAAFRIIGTGNQLMGLIERSRSNR